jgi:DNA (cytosine-5)-methyltransferase 1
MKKLRVLDLFSGIGGFSLGLERTGGFETVAFCEIEPYPRAVLAKHWPHVPCYDDVRTLTADALSRDGIAVDVICGGFPCQDISFAGRGAGLAGERSGLWSEYARLIRELRPRFVIVENVAALLGRGLDAVLGDLAALGYDAEWHCITAAAVGAPHRRDRLWIVAYPGSEQHEGDCAPFGREIAAQLHAADAYRESVREQQIGELWSGGEAVAGFYREAADPNGESKYDGAEHAEVGRASEFASDATPMHGAAFVGSEPHGDHAGTGDVADAKSRRRLQRHSNAGRCSQGARAPQEWQGFADGGWWLVEPDVGRVAHGVPSRVDRLKGLGNAVVPQIPELIGHAILKAEGLAA